MILAVLLDLGGMEPNGCCEGIRRRANTPHVVCAAGVYCLFNDVIMTHSLRNRLFAATTS